jgi:hypothetical protein
VLVKNDLYVLFGTNVREYFSNVYRINLNKLESVKLFDSIKLLDNANMTQLEMLKKEYPDDFLYGRYRQECVYYENKIYAFGGGKNDGDAYPLEKV